MKNRRIRINRTATAILWVLMVLAALFYFADTIKLFCLRLPILQLIMPYNKPFKVILYPQAPAMPQLVTIPMADLLGSYETFLKIHASAVYADLQPGLSDEQISALEQQHSVTLTQDLRALYRWRNGSMTSSDLGTFPNHRFIPLGDAFDAVQAYEKSLKALTPIQKQTHDEFAGHRTHWVAIIIDLAGDGYYYDPQRTQEQGSFFFNFNEDGHYIFYPSIRNYIAQVVQGCENGIYHKSTTGIEIADYDKYQALENQFGVQRNW